MGAFIPLYLPKLGIRPEDVPFWVGFMAAVSGLIGIPLLPFWGALADRYSRQPLIVRSFVAHSLAGVVSILAGNIWVFILGRAIMSFALGNSGLMMATLSERAPRERVGFAFAVMNGAAPFGAFVGPLIGGPVVDRWGFPLLLLIDTAIMVTVVLVLTFGYRDSFIGADRGPLLHMALDSVRIIWRSPRLMALFPALFLLFTGMMTAFTYVPLAILGLYSGGEPATAVGVVIGLSGFVSLFLAPALGALADRYGHWRVLIIAAVVEVFLWPLPALAPDLASFTLAWTILNGLASSVFAISFSVLSHSTEASVLGRIMSFAYLPVNVAGIAGPAVASILAKSNVFAIFPAAAIATAMGVVALLYARRKGDSNA
jgi:DHA1 family multidrug resistance protein-like MFS transporter